MAIADGEFPGKGLLRGTNALVNFADHLEPTPLTANETVTITSATAVALTADSAAIGATIVVDVAPIRFWVNGIAPTNSVGLYVNAGGCIELSSPAEIAGFKAIAATDTSAILQVSYWR